MKLTRHGRVRLATALWIAVSVMLIWRGTDPFLGRMETTGGKVMTLLLAAVIGAAKGHFVIRKSAARTAKYIANRPERDWFWNAFHPVMYLIIPLMIAMGVWLRNYVGNDYPWIVVGVYVGVAAGLLASLRGFALKPA